jgi:hypothetical protein
MTMALAKKNVTKARLPAGGKPKLAQQPINRLRNKQINQISPAVFDCLVKAWQPRRI